MDKKKMLTRGVCPWCQSPVNDGAAACKSCGASEINGWQSLGNLRHVIWIVGLCFLAIPGLVVMSFAPSTGIIMVVAGIGGPIALQIAVKGNRNWVAPGYRVRI